MKIVTFNIRCVWDRDGINGFVHRAGGIVDKISHEQPDVICFQECTEPIIGLLKRSLPDYLIVFNQRDADRKGEGLATALRKDKAELLGFDAFWLSPTPNVPGSRYEVQSTCPRICQCLTIRINNAVFRVYNIHLDHMSDEARMLGMDAVLKRVESDIKSEEMPLFILGDFNATADSDPIRLCHNNPYIELAELTKDIIHTFHGFGKRTDGHKIDYIFSDKKTENALDGIKIWDDEHCGIYLSDHYPIEAEIKFS